MSGLLLVLVLVVGILAGAALIIWVSGIWMTL